MTNSIQSEGLIKIKPVANLFFKDTNIKTAPIYSSGGGGGGGGAQVEKKIEALGLLLVQPGSALERGKEIEEATSLLNNNENIMVLGDAGTGKTTLVKNIAKELATSGKQVVEIPATFFQTGTVGNVASSIKNLITTFTPDELKKIVFFVDEIHSVVNMGTFGTGDQDHETPRNILKPYLTGDGEQRIVMIGATTTKEYQERIFERDAAFCRRFQNIVLHNFSLDQIKRIMLDDSVKADFKRSGLKLSDLPEDLKRYEQVTSYGCELLDKFAQYQAFPEKSAKFFKRLFSGKNINEVTQQNIEYLISETLNIPLEIVTKEINSDSKYFKLREDLKVHLVGQDSAIDIIANKILNFTTREADKPLSFLSIGSTGVGKTETVEAVATDLNLPLIKFNMGEYKTPSTTTEFVSKLTSYIKNNYTGVILFDELEKANPEILDAILSLTDKGQIGSGQSLVTSKSQIIFMTSNLIQKTITEFSEILKDDGIKEIPDRLLRQLIESETNLKPEFIGRIDSILHYHNLTVEDSLEIGKRLLDKKLKLFESTGIKFEIDEASFNKIAAQSYEDIGGVRMICKNLDGFIAQITSNQEVILNLKNKVMIGEIDKIPNKITISYIDGNLNLIVNNKEVNIVRDNNKDTASVQINYNDVFAKIEKMRKPLGDDTCSKNQVTV